MCSRIGNYLNDNGTYRHLTAIEGERLQGFTDNWTQLGASGKEYSRNQRKFMIGNAVTTNVIYDILKEWNI